MLRRIFLTALAIVPSLMFAQRFGVINTDELIASLPEVKAVEIQLDTYSRQYETDFNSLKVEMDRKYAELQNLPVGTPEEIVKRRVAEIQELDQKIDQFRNTASADLKNHEDALMAPIRARVSEAVRQVGDEGDFIMIFENTSPVYIRRDVVDVTPLVKEKLASMN